MASVVWTYVRREKYFLFETYIFIRMVGIGIYYFTVNLLVQDKVCVNFYNQSAEFCQRINENDYAHSETHTKDLIFAESAQFNNYRNLIQSIPMLVWSFFVGSFLDQYRGGTKFLFGMGNFVDVIDLICFMLSAHFFYLSPYLILLTPALNFLTGGMISFLTSANRYIILHTNEKQRPIKFVIFQFIFLVSIALGTFIGGQMLVFTDDGPQLRNYNLNFAIASVLNAASFVIVFIINWDPKVKSDKPERIQNSDFEEAQMGSESVFPVDSNHNPQTQPIIGDKPRRKSWFTLIRLLINWQNIKDTLHCLTRTRPGHQRAQIFLLNSIILIYFFVGFGIDAIFLQFTEKAYHWDSHTYATVSAIAKILPNVIMLLLSYVLIKRLQIADGTLLVSCIPFGIFSYTLIGTILKSAIYIFTIPLTAVANLSMVVAKNKLSKVISTDEIGKIFSLISVMEAMVPYFGSLVFTQIFTATVSTLPGTIFQACGVFNFVALLLAIVQELFYS